MSLVRASLRVSVATIALCVVAYTALNLGIAQGFTRDTANGSLVTDESGTVVGSRLIAQAFERPEYFWPRPSAVDYDGAGAGGSNKSPTSDALTERAEELIARYGATPEAPLPPELAAASGAGLDPHVSEYAALYQAPRVAGARGIPDAEVEALIAELAFAPGGRIASGRLLNVLDLNLALDSRHGSR